MNTTPPALYFFWMVLPFILWGCWISDKKIHEHLEEHRRPDSVYRPRASLWDLTRGNSFGYNFGFVFDSRAEFFSLVFMVLTGKSMRPIRGWMRLWCLSVICLWSFPPVVVYSMVRADEGAAILRAGPHNGLNSTRV